MMETTVPPDSASSLVPRILCVDDEPNILASLRRLFRAQGYHVITAESGKEGLEKLESGPVDIVISDMRMPEMDGARFLERVRNARPETLRLLLTGYADVQSILDAINRGEIYRYITKPWDDNDILLIVRHAIERKALEQEKQRLEALSQRQNQELKELNACLEATVQKRTAELKQAHDSLLTTNEKLKSSFLTSIKVFSGMTEMRSKNLAGHSRRVADLARRIAGRMQLEPHDMQDVFVAGLLHNIGKIAFPDEMLSMPVSMMKGDMLGLYRKHPQLGEQLLTALVELRGAAKIIRSQMERFDGEGFPDHLAGLAIPIGARILALASDFDNLQIGTLTQRRLRPDEAVTLILQNSGKRYDPQVVKAFAEIIHGGLDDMAKEIQVTAGELQSGMVLARDLFTNDGLLLLPADHVLDHRLIQQIMSYDVADEGRLKIFVRTDRSGA